MSGDSSQPLAHVAVRNVIIDIAARRSFGIKDGASSSVTRIISHTFAGDPTFDTSAISFESVLGNKQGVCF